MSQELSMAYISNILINVFAIYTIEESGYILNGWNELNK